MMSEAWTKNRVASFIEVYGTPDNPTGPYKNRMAMIAKRIPQGNVLDVACGMGHLYNFIQDREYRGVDISPVMIEKGLEFFPDADLEVRDVYDLSGEAIHDVVVATSFLIHINHQDLGQVLKQMWAHARKSLVFTISISWDFTRVDYPQDPERMTVITNVSKEHLNKLVFSLEPQPKGVMLTYFNKGCFGYGLNDYIMEVRK